ncbi:MAG: hypothetical protein RL463_1186, partial [Bacteroidota bacterium]
LRVVKLCDGLKKIRAQAFACCEYLDVIKIPSTVTYIAQDAFDEDIDGIEFDSLLAPDVGTDLKLFYEELLIEIDYMPMILQTYSNFSRGNILARIQRLKANTWQEIIKDMAREIPNENATVFQRIEEKLRHFETRKNWIENVAMVLGLYLRKQGMTSSDIIIPNVMSFFLPSGQSLSLFPNFAKRRKLSHQVDL